MRRAAHGLPPSSEQTPAGTQNRGLSLAAKGAYYEPVPQKMDFPSGVKHQNQLVDYKTVAWLRENHSARQ